MHSGFLPSLLAVTVLLPPVYVQAAPAAAPAETKHSNRPPNIIFFLTDDLGWGDPQCFGHPYIKTPNINRLAEQGTVFTQFYVASPVCSPSRVALMTGHYPARYRIHIALGTPQRNAEYDMPNWLDPKVPTLAGCLKQAGYVTGHFGKWHLCGSPTPQPPSPAAYGFDDHRTVNTTGPGWEMNKDPYFRAHSTGLIVDETIRFMRQHKDQPFYVNAWTLVPHAPLKSTDEELAAYHDLKADPDRFEGHMREYARKAPDFNNQAKVFFAAVTGLDKAFGRLLDALEEMKLAENTLIFFGSDNGPEDYHLAEARNAGMGSPGPHRGRKRSIYEGGVRTSCIVRWPGHVPAGRVERDSVLAGVDFLPTICRITGAAVPDIQPDGEDVSDILRGKSRPRMKSLFWEWRGPAFGDTAYRPPGLAVRDGNWKLLVNPDGTAAELYDIVQDPDERHNVAKDHPEIAGNLSRQVLAWKKTLPK